MSVKGLLGTSGIRRIADKRLFRLALDVGLAMSGNYPEVVVSCDTRTSGDAIKKGLV